MIKNIAFDFLHLKVIASGLPALQSTLPNRCTLKIIIVIWISSISMSLAPLFGWNAYVYEVRRLHMKFKVSIIVLSSLPFMATTNQLFLSVFDKD